MSILLNTVFLFVFVMVSAVAPAWAEDGAAGFSMQVMDAFKVTGRGTVLTGKISSGTLAKGDIVCVPLKSGGASPSPVLAIEARRREMERAEAGQLVGVLVEGVDPDDVEKMVVMRGNCSEL